MDARWMGLFALGCGGDGEPGKPTGDSGGDTASPPVTVALPPVDPGLHLGVAGVPNDLFGDEAAPAFAEVFAGLAADGFDRFVPVFLTSESGEGGPFATYFAPGEAFPPDVFGPVPPELTCEGPFNPFVAAQGSVGIVFPGYLLALDQPFTVPVDEGNLRDRFEALLRDCLGGDPALVSDVYSYDEPANNYMATLCCDADPAATFELGNVARLDAVSSEVLGVPTLVVEAPVPFFLAQVADAWGIDPAMIDGMITDFEAGVAQTAPVADRYGFDVYPVDLDPDLGTIVDHVALARQAAPSAAPLVVLQGFGMADMEIDVGTPGRQPTRDETRAMALLAVSAGAESVYWYGQSALTADDPVWADLREVAADLRAASGVFQLPSVPWDAPAGVRVDARAADGFTWVLAVEHTGASATVSLPEGAEVRDGWTLELLPPGPLELGPYGSRLVAVIE
ncbi:MAG: hypothetical protein ABMA64_35940 [Myxococcota bacterium]